MTPPQEEVEVALSKESSVSFRQRKSRHQQVAIVSWESSQCKPLISCLSMNRLSVWSLTSGKTLL